MTTYTYTAGATDCWGDDAAQFFSDTDYLWLGGSALGWARTWIPFVVNLPKNKVIKSATFSVVCTVTRAGGPALKIGCEASDNPTAPTDNAGVMGRLFTTAFTSVAQEDYTAGTTYTYDVTTAVQEILNRAGWAAGNTMAIYIAHTGTLGDRRQIAAVEHLTYAAPQLTVVLPFIPSAIAAY
jgi:hypothetical protein